jgi:small subunit ribosomal protein S3Ae
MAFRKIKLQCEEVKGTECYTSIYGFDITRDLLCQIIRKWHSLIEARVDVKTADGYFIRLFCIGFTARRGNQLKATCYAKASQKKAIRKIMMETMVKEAQRSSIRDLTEKW